MDYGTGMEYVSSTNEDDDRTDSVMCNDTLITLKLAICFAYTFIVVQLCRTNSLCVSCHCRCGCCQASQPCYG